MFDISGDKLSLYLYIYLYIYIYVFFCCLLKALPGQCQPWNPAGRGGIPLPSVVAPSAVEPHKEPTNHPLKLALSYLVVGGWKESRGASPSAPKAIKLVELQLIWLNRKQNNNKQKKTYIYIYIYTLYIYIYIDLLFRRLIIIPWRI